MRAISARLSDNQPMVIGHRGFVAPPGIPENTLPAFNKAFTEGADGIELDLQLTRDDQIVIFHDWTLKRFWNIPTKISRINSSELRAYHFETAGNSNAVGIPTLEELFQKLGGAGYFNLELKTKSLYPGRLVKAVIEKIALWKVEDRVWISSFHPLVPGIVKKVNPQIVTGFLFSHWNYWSARVCRKAYVDVLHPGINLLAHLNEFSATGKPIVFWSVNEPAQIKQLASQNKIHFITDNIKGCREALAASRLPGEPLISAVKT